MAENNNNQKEVLLKVTSDTSEANSGLDAVKQKIQQANESARELSKVDYGAMSVRELKEELDKAEMSMEQLESSGQATADAMRVIGGRVDEISGALKGIQGQRSFETFKGSIMASTGAVEALEGAMIALGFENEEFEKTIQRIMGIRAFKDGIEDVFEYGASLKGLVVGMNGAVSASKVLKLALSGLGIGLLVTAVMYLIENWDKLSVGLKDALPQVKGLSFAFDNFKAILLTVGQTIVGAVLPVVKNMISAFSNAYSGIKQIFSGDITGGLKSLGQAFVDASPINHIASFTNGLINGVKNFKTNLNTNIAQLAEDKEIKKSAKEGGKKVGKELAKGVSEGVKDEFANNVVSDELDKEFDKLVMKAIKNNADANRVIREANTEARQLALEDVREEYAEKIRIAEEAGLSITSLLEAQRIKEKEINDKYDKEEAQTKAQLKGDTGILNAENAYDDSTIEREVESIKKLTQARLDALKMRYDAEVLLYEGNEEKLTFIKAKYESDRTKIEEEGAEATKEIQLSRMQMINMVLEESSKFLDASVKLLGESTTAGKALAIAQTTIDTYLGAQKAFTSMAGIPIVGPALGAIAAGTAIVNGLANVKRIMAIKTDGKSTSAPTGGGIATTGFNSTASAPIINTQILNRGETEDLNSLNGNSSNTQTVSPIRAYIVDKDIQKSKEKNELTDKLSTF